MLRRCRRGIDRCSQSARLHHAGRCEEASRRARPAVDGRAPARDAGGRRRGRAGRSQRERRVHLRQDAAARDRSTRALPDRSGSTTSRSSTKPPSDPKRVFFGAWVTVEDEDGDGGDLPDRRSRMSPTSTAAASAWTRRSRGPARQARRRRGHRARPEGRDRVHDRHRDVRVMSPVPEPIVEERPSKRDRRLAARATSRRTHARQSAGGPGARSPCCATAARPTRRCSTRSRPRSRSILLETYILAADHTGDRFKAALIERARAGVKVRMIYDAVGSFGLPGSWVDELRAAGCEVIDFNPIAPWRRRFRLSAPRSPQDDRRRQRGRVHRRPQHRERLRVGRRWRRRLARHALPRDGADRRSTSRGCSAGRGCAPAATTFPPTPSAATAPPGDGRRVRPPARQHAAPRRAARCAARTST